MSRMSPVILVVIALLLPLACERDTEKGKWVAKIGTATIFEKEFNAILALTLESSGVPKEQLAQYRNDRGIKQKVLDDYISKYLVVRKAERENFYNSKEAKEYIELAVRSLKFEYYVRKKMLEFVPDPTPQEIELFYTQQRAILEKQYGIRSLDDRGRIQVSNLLKMQRVQKKLMQLVEDLKGETPVTRNKDVMGESVDLNMAPGSMAPSGLPR
ncbi:MAG: hypothetical protein AABZ39_12755 [Spirochaetota bacterium]